LSPAESKALSIFQLRLTDGCEAHPSLRNRCRNSEGRRCGSAADRERASEGLLRNTTFSRTNVASEAQEVIDEPDTALGCRATRLGAESWGISSVLRRFEDRTNSPPPGDQEKAFGEENGGDSTKTVPVRDLQKKLKLCIDEAQEGRVVITRRGRPAALLLGVEGKDWETVILETNPTSGNSSSYAAKNPPFLSRN
jgi:prevent-host-death family protein